ncbi:MULTISPECIES: winged helix-turn-helix transcriptional regulator [unclassified Rhodococcus (in: high G+C Gram-positive bacteria)]
MLDEAGPPVSVAYELTPAGRALLPSLTALTEWARENLPAQRVSG